jgi:SAM-dependent methyltransferase
MSASPTERLLPGLASLHEGLGSAYERYAVGRLTERLVHELGVRSIAEWPANGVLGVPGLKSLPLALLGCDVTLVSPSKELLEGARTVWHAVGAEPELVVASPEDDGVVPESSFDLVWSFCAFEHARDPQRLARAMVRAARGHVLVFVQNAWMPGVHLHRLHHAVEKRTWDHGAISAMRAETVAARLRAEGADVVELGGCDLPPWPDINVKLPRPEPRGVRKHSGPRPYGPGDAVLTPADAARILAETTEVPPAVRALAAWHDRVERSLPTSLLRFIAHHPYVLAKKGAT